MCTVTWFRQLGGFELFTNRDERRTRPMAHPPRLQEAEDGQRFLAPVDTEAGGSWIAANESGVAVCLLNHYQAEVLPNGVEPRSRGLIVTDLMAARDLDEAFDRLRATDLSATRGFRLIVLEQGGPPGLATWDTRTLALSRGDEVAPPLISSGFDFEAVARSRGELFDRMVGEAGAVTADVLTRFHASEEPEPGPYAVSMSRPDAWTVSHTRVVVDADAVSMHYQAGRPSEGGPVVVERLERAAPRTR